MLVIAWIFAYLVLALIFTVYYRRWLADVARADDSAPVPSFADFLRKPVADEALERRRRFGSVFGYGLIAFGVLGLVIPLR